MTAIRVYTYKADGLRYSKETADGKTVHLWDGQNIAAELDETGTPIAVYHRGINLLARESGSGFWYYLYNAHGDVVQYVSEGGSVLKRYDYDAFGNERIIESADANPFRYCGEYYDGETNTYYLRARYYDPVVGRFVTEDSVQEMMRKLPNGKEVSDPLSLNLYAYTYNNPLLFQDPSGHIAVATIILIGSVVVGLVAAGVTAYQSKQATGSIDWQDTILSGISWGMMAYTFGMSAYVAYQSYAAYKGFTPVSEVVFNSKVSGGNVGKVNILSNKTLTNQTSKVNNYVSATKGFDAAKKDFYAQKPSNIRTYSNGTIVGELPNGTTINVRPSSSGGYPTVEIYNPVTGINAKIRY